MKGSRTMASLHQKLASVDDLLIRPIFFFERWKRRDDSVVDHSSIPRQLPSRNTSLTLHLGVFDEFHRVGREEPLRTQKPGY